MDELKIRTKPGKKMVAAAIRKLVRSKCGIDLMIKFAEDKDIELMIDDGAHLSISAEADISKHDLEILKEKLGL